MGKGLTAMLLSNPNYEYEIYRLYAELPEYKQVAGLMDQWHETVRQALGEEPFLAFEDVLTRYYGIQAQAYYFFGLRLRQELCDALMWESQVNFTSAC